MPQDMEPLYLAHESDVVEEEPKVHCCSRPFFRCCCKCCTPKCCGLSLLGFLALLGIFFIGPRFGPSKFGENWIVGEGNAPYVISHGDCPCLPEPANSMLWFEYAAGLGVDALEFDLQMTKDDVLVAFHDREFDKLTNAAGLVRDMTFAEMQKTVDVSESYEKYADVLVSPPSIESIFERFAGTDLKFNVEIKTEIGLKDIVAEKLCSLLEEYRVEGRMLVASFDSESLVAFRQRCGHAVATSGSAEETEKSLIPILLGLDRWWLRPGYLSVLQLPLEAAGFDLTDKKIIERAHAHGMAVQYWVVNDEEEMRKVIESGADGILTDEVEKLMSVLEEMGY